MADKATVATVAHFHCDHFEPYMPILDGKAAVGVEYARNMLSSLSEALPIKLSAFFSSQSFVKYIDTTKFHPGGDRVATDEEIMHVLGEFGADMQIHIHHESWPDNGEALAQLIELLKDQRLRLLGIPNDRPWAFIHGCWALNASDLSVCLIENELSILVNGGCVADFTFPAGRSHCDPPWKYPSLVLPAAGKKGYALPGADPIPAPSIGAGRFFIWSTELSYNYASLDSVSINRLDPKVVVDEWLSKSPVIDGTLYIKTHAHSLNSLPCPLLSPSVIACFEELQARCQQLGLPVAWITVSDVLKALVL